MENRVSVIIPTYNRAGLVVRAVKSVLAAMSEEDELIVIDDGSIDNTSEVLQPFFETIRYVRTENFGMDPARDLGISLARNPLIALLDSDDEWLPDKINLQRTVMNAFPQLVFCFSDLRSRLPNGRIVHNVLDIWRNDQWVGFENAKEGLDKILDSSVSFSSIGTLPQGRTNFNIYRGNIYTALMEVYYVWASVIMVRKERAGSSFRFSRGLHQICEDWECFAELAMRGPVAYLDCETAVQHVHSGPRQTDVGSMVQVTERIALLHRVWGRDVSFLKTNASRFQKVLNGQYLRRARYLIKMGRLDEAKEDLLKIGGMPLFYLLLTSLPLWLVSFAVSLRRKILKLRRSF